MELAEILKAAPHFASLSAEDLEAVASAITVEEYPDKHAFIRQGDRGTAVFVVVEGKVAVSAAHLGATHELGVLGPGELFGLIALVDSEPRSATCSAVGKCRVGSLASAAAALLFNQRAPVACTFQMALALQIAKDFRRLERALRDHLDASTRAPAV